MAFDPDAYLAKNSATPAFDPDAYLSAGDENYPVVDEAANLDGRFAVKNFGNSPEAALQYLQKKNPNQVLRLVDGEVQARGKNDQQWKKLDPGGFPELADLSDIATDVVGGVGQGLATTAGAGLGMAAGPAGAVAGGVAASGAASAGTEALRQKLGQYLGINEGVNTNDVAWAGGLGAASTALLGAGKVGGQQVKGLLQKGYEVGKNTVAPKVASALSGVPVDRIKGYANNMEAVDQLEREGVTGYVDKLKTKLTDWLDESKTTAGKNVRAAVEGANTPVDITQAKASFTNRIAQLKAKPNISEADAAEIEALESAYQQYFGLAKPIETTDVNTFKTTIQKEIPDTATGAGAFDLQQQLKQLAQFEQGMTPSTASMKGSARGAYGALNEGLEVATEAASPVAKAEYKRMLDIEDVMGNSFDSTQKTYNTMTGIDSKGRKVLAERLKALAQSDGGVDVSKEAEILGAYESFAKPGLNALSTAGTTSTSRTIPAASIGAGLGTLIGYKLGGGVGGAVGGLVGAGAGSMIGSPATVKAAIKAGMKIEEIAARTGLSHQAIQKMAAPAATEFSYELLSPSAPAGQ